MYMRKDSEYNNPNDIFTMSFVLLFNLSGICGAPPPGNLCTSTSTRYRRRHGVIQEFEVGGK